MSRKDYIKLAAVLAKHRASEEMVSAFCVELAADNCRFNAQRFRDAAQHKTPCNPDFYGLTTVTLRATDHRPSYAQNTHRVILRSETDEAFYGWPDPADKRNSENWKPGIDTPLEYPKFAWEIGGCDAA